MGKMYETLMNLPLFKGVSPNQISQFLEKTNVGFVNFNRGEFIATYEDKVDRLRFIITGGVSGINRIAGHDVSIVEKLGRGTVLGAERLFGLNPRYNCNYIVENKASIMEFSKQQYVQLLKTDYVFMLNFLNYISLRAQHGRRMIEKWSGGDLHSRICLMVSLMTDPSSDSIEIRATDSSLAAYFNVEEEDISEWKMKQEESGAAKYSPVEIVIHNLKEFLDR